MSWAAQAAKPVESKEDTPLRVVQIDGLVALKMIRHCKENMPSLVTGQLLGLDIGSILEVTSCFPFPSRSAAEDNAEADLETDGANYQLEMMRCLREVNVDNNTVGWYQSTYLGSYQTVELIETFMNYQENIKRCVCIVYDPLRSTNGGLALKALKVKDTFLEMYRKEEINVEKLIQGGNSWNVIFEEIPVSIHNSALVKTMMEELDVCAPATQCDFDRLGISTNPFLEKNLEFLNECLDDLQVEQQKQVYYQRNVLRQQQQQQQWLQKRRQENAQRRANGETPLPEEDPNNPIFKPVPEPSKIDGMLVANQIHTYCEQIDGFGKQSLSKLNLMKALH